MSTRVNIVDASGSLFNIDQNELGNALSQGYTLASPEQSAVGEYVKENEGIKGDIKVGLGQLANQFALGAPEVYADYTDSPLERAKREAIKEDHEIANIAGGATGFVLGLPLGGGLAKVGGSVAERIIANKLGAKLAETGIRASESGIKGASKGLGTRLLERAAIGAGEGVALSAPVAITESALGDPYQAAETLLAGGLIGAVVNPSFYSAGKALESTKNYLSKKVGLSASSLEGGRTRVDLDELMSASERLGINKEQLPQGMTTQSASEAYLENSISQGASIPGEMIKSKYNAVFGKIDDNLAKLLEPRAEASLYESGDEIKSGLLNIFAKEKQAAGEIYNRLEQQYGKAPIPEGWKNISEQFINELDPVKLKLTNIGQGIIDMFAEAKTANDLKLIRTRLGGLAKNQTDLNNKYVLDEARDLAKSAIDISYKNLPMPEAEKAALFKDLANANAIYKGIFDKFAPISEALGGKLKNLSQLENRIADKFSSENMMDKLFRKKNADLINHIKNNFPEVFELLKGSKLAEIYKKSVSGTGTAEKIDTNKFLRQVTSLEPEVKKMIWGDRYLQVEKDLKTVIGSMPPKAGPSGTPQGMMFLAIANPILQVTEFARYALLKTGLIEKLTRRDGLLLTERALGNTAKKLDSIPGILTGKILPTPSQITTTALQRLLKSAGNKDEDFDKLTDHVSNIATAGTPPEHITKMASYLAQTGAPRVAESFGMRVNGAIKYLHDQAPKAPQAQSMFHQTKWKPSQAQIAAYARKVEAIENPFSILTDYQNGTLTKDKVDAVRAVYPAIFAQIQKRILKTATEHKLDLPYQKRIQLSILLGMPVDESLKSIQALQQNYQQVESNADSTTGSMPMAKGKFKNNLSDAMKTQVEHLATRKH